MAPMGIALGISDLESLLKHGNHFDLNGLELYEELSTLLPHTKSMMDIVQFIHTSKLVDIYPNVYVATRILLTIPVTVASGEQSFSKLKLIKNYLRSTRSQEHLTGLAILAIKRDITLSLSYDDIITDFAAKKARKIVFN